MPESPPNHHLNSLSPHAFYLPAPSGRLFTLYRPPQASATRLNRLVILVAPFGEEMNASRRAYSVLAQRLSADGIASLMFDFFGCGDSEGEFAAASWETWLQDLNSIVAYARQHWPDQTLQLLGLRSASLLIAEHIVNEGTDNIERIVLWQPLMHGSEQVNQFLRLRLAANILQAQSAQRETTQSLREIARRQGSVEVAGYELTPTLIDALDRRQCLSLLQAAGQCPPLTWLELGAQTQLSGARAQTALSLRQHGVALDCQHIACKRFWAIADAPLPVSLLERTRQILLAGAS
jgi:exosortase A-associated hydrolase 2